MWTVIAVLVLLGVGFAAGTLNSLYNFSRWRTHLPEDLRDVVDGAIKQYPL